jgi:RNA polymerase sigma-70 factor, ECF subfamily
MMRKLDQACSEAAIQEYLPQLRRYFARRVVGNVDDLVQETLLATLEARGRQDGPIVLHAYLFGTARLVLLAHLRKRRQTVLRESMSERELEELRTSPSYVEPQDALVLERALAQLDDGFRRVIELVFWNQLSAPEIARQLELPLATVYSRLRRGVLKLRSALAAPDLDAQE